MPKRKRRPKKTGAKIKTIFIRKGVAGAKNVLRVTWPTPPKTKLKNVAGMPIKGGIPQGRGWGLVRKRKAQGRNKRAIPTWQRERLINCFLYFFLFRTKKQSRVRRKGTVK